MILVTLCLTLPELGQIVRVRSRQYLVEDVIPPSCAEGDTQVRLACLEDDAQGEALEVFWEREIDAQVLAASSWEAVTQRGFDQPRQFSAYLHALRWNCVTATEPKLFQAGIEVKSYQLEPLRKALRMPRVNLFIADDPPHQTALIPVGASAHPSGHDLQGFVPSPHDSDPHLC